MKRLKVLSLAALVAFAACDEGTEPITVPDVTGTISGVVTIEGTAKSGVSVTLSTGATTSTDASGAYSFGGIKAGTYTVSISGFPTDAAFSTTTKGATIATSGQVQTVNFDGAYVRTAAILGSVAAGGSGLAGVKVTLSGANTAGANVNTDANGQYAFTGLRAGSYTVTISGFDATQFTFASTTASVTVAAGQSQVASFNGTKVATAKITGTVTVEGAPANGVTVTLSSGPSTTTDAFGAYAFGGLMAGTYTVTISGFASDATFTSVAQTVTITTAGSTVNANFAGTYVKTASIVGTVTVGATGLPGVKVTLNTGETVNTDTNGQYSFAGLRAGTYTVTISGFDATTYTFATTSSSVTVAAGESKIAGFAGAYVATAGISGILFLDEGVKNLTYDGSAFEKTYALSGVTITIEGGAVATYQTTTTSDGVYSFTNLVPGTYRVAITPPANGTFGWAGGSQTAVVTLAPGGAVVVNWPFRILRQYVKVYSFLGKDATVVAPAGVPSGVRPQQGITIDLYDTYDNAVGAVPAGLIGTAITDATGGVTFNYLRSTDNSPNDTPDNIVFAKYSAATTPANLTPNGEAVIEIKYPGSDTLAMAPDTFDLLNSGTIIRFNAMDGRDNLLAGWAWEIFQSSVGDTMVAPTFTGTTAVAAPIIGRQVFAGVALPDTVFIRLNPVLATQPAGTKAFSQTPEGPGVSRYLRYVIDGTQPDSVTLLGTERVKFTMADLKIRVHNEVDDTANYTTPLDVLANATPFNVAVYEMNTDGVSWMTPAVVAFTPVNAVTGDYTALNLPTGKKYLVVAQRAAGVTNQVLVSDTAHSVYLDGSVQQDTASYLGVKGPVYSTFAWKYNDGMINGSMFAVDGVTPAPGLKVRIKTTSRFIGPAKDTTVTVGAGGAFTTFTAAPPGAATRNLLQGQYTVQAMDGDSASVWNFLTKLAAGAGVTFSGNATVANTSAELATRVLGLASAALATETANFQPTRMDTKILGNIANDRDADLTTLDPNEALEGAVVRLYRDGSGAVGYDTLVAEATTDINGRYSFSGLREGRYAIRYISGGGSVTVLRAIAKDSAVVTTAAAVGTGAQGTRIVGTQTHTLVPAVGLPRWDYANSVLVANATGDPDFTFLFTNTTVKGTVKTGGGVAIAGMTVSLRRCNVSAAGAATSPPTGAAVCTSYLGTTVNMSSDAAGAFEFPNLVEGVYEIRPQPTTVAGWLSSAPAQILYLTVGSGDIETYDFVIS
ncbi:MAG: carboxypeptidase regulatory-like domain-containing protein [Longimicrobiales bacterium]